MRGARGTYRRSRAVTTAAAGFTLIELLMVVVIIGIMGSVTVPTFRGFMQEQKLNAASRDLITNLRFARMRAVNERNQWVIMFNRPGRRYVVFSDDGGGGGLVTSPDYLEENRNNLRPDPGERVYGPFDLSAGVVFGMVVSSGLPNNVTVSNAISFAGSPPVIVFYPNGSARETGAIMLHLSDRLRTGDPTGQRAVVLYKPTGAARTFEYNPGGSPQWK